MTRLNQGQLDHLSSGIAWAPRRVDCAGADIRRIVHLGLGAFARAHLAEYVQDANEACQEEWRMIGVSLQRPDMRDALEPQQGLYTLVVCAPEGPRYRVMNVVHEVLVAPEDPGAVIMRMADPATHIVSLTVTEKGYCHEPSTGRLRLNHPDIVHDLAHPQSPRSAIGMIVAGLGSRRVQGLSPFTVLCCDNLPENGAVVRALVLELAHLQDEALAAWIAREGAFPCTMVDRIVPATTAADIAETALALGCHDAAPVMGEPFRQWVIEDRFVSSRPAWERVGVQMVENVAPFELMKLRMLNGAHSTLAYLGYLAGQETVHETISEASGNKEFAQMLKRLWGEIIPTVPAPPGVDLVAYSQALLCRFQNAAMRHRTWQIAMDGSQKLPQRLLATIQHALAAGGNVEALCLGVAGWMRYVMGFDEKGAAIDVRDPLSAEFAAIMAHSSGKAELIVDGLLGLKQIFGDQLPHNRHLRQILVAQLESLMRHGVRETLRRQRLQEELQEELQESLHENWQENLQDNTLPPSKKGPS